MAKDDVEINVKMAQERVPVCQFVATRLDPCVHTYMLRTYDEIKIEGNEQTFQQTISRSSKRIMRQLLHRG